MSICLFIRIKQISLIHSFIHSSFNQLHGACYTPGCVLRLMREICMALLSGKSPPSEGRTRSHVAQVLRRERWGQWGYRRERGQESAMEGFLEEVAFELSADTRAKRWWASLLAREPNLRREQTGASEPRSLREAYPARGPGVCWRVVQATGFKWKQQRRSESVFREHWAGVTLSPWLSPMSVSCQPSLHTHSRKKTFGQLWWTDVK